MINHQLLKIYQQLKTKSMSCDFMSWWQWRQLNNPACWYNMVGGGEYNVKHSTHTVFTSTFWIWYIGTGIKTKLRLCQLLWFKSHSILDYLQWLYWQPHFISKSHYWIKILKIHSSLETFFQNISEKSRDLAPTKNCIKLCSNSNTQKAIVMFVNIYLTKFCEWTEWKAVISNDI